MSSNQIESGIGAMNEEVLLLVFSKQRFVYLKRWAEICYIFKILYEKKIMSIYLFLLTELLIH